VGFLSWLLGDEKKSYASQPPPTDAIVALKLRSSGGFPLACVGELHYQHALETICPRTEESAAYEVVAHLVLDFKNAHDSNAVRVEVNGMLVGYLARDDAALYRRRLFSLSPGVVTTTCRAQIRGGWDRGPRDRGHYGVWLDLPI
jgi:hypothetical protein